MLVSRAYDLVSLASANKEVPEEPLWRMLEALVEYDKAKVRVLVSGSELEKDLLELEHNLSHAH